jgi:hypothetical protein
MDSYKAFVLGCWRALATELHRRGRAQPERFKELVDRCSEVPRRSIGGRLRQLVHSRPEPVSVDAAPPAARRGRDGHPVETQLGFEVILCTEPPVREQDAVRAVRLSFAPTAAPATAEGARVCVLAEAEALDPSYSAELQRFGRPASCPVRWHNGRANESCPCGATVRKARARCAGLITRADELSFRFPSAWRPSP